MSAEKPWTQPMPEELFALMREILAAPSPVGLEGAMTQGVLRPYFEQIKRDGWAIHQFCGNAGLVLDTAPDRDDLLTVMLIGHADKIRMQVRSIGEDGKIWINSDSFLPNVLIGHEVTLFSRDPANPHRWRRIEGGTVEALGAIHFADADTRSGKKGVRAQQLYLELQTHGEKRKQQIEALGVRVGDPIILNRPIKRGFSPDTFYGAYLDNGLGCFVAAQVAEHIAKLAELEHVRVLFAIASHEEIGRMGSRVLAGEFSPDVILGLDVTHDYEAAPGIKDRRLPQLRMGKGFSYVTGAITSEYLNALIEEVALEHDIPFQRNVAGRDTGTDGMAGFFASVDSASTSIGFPIRNMHTISETGHTGDVLAAIHMCAKLIERFEALALTASDFASSHPRLDLAEPLAHQGVPGDAADDEPTDAADASEEE